jgi:hypothetical protein
MKIKVGDTVITNRFEYSPFYSKSFSEEMEALVGKQGIVREAWADTLKVHGNFWPPSACTKVEPETTTEKKETTLKPFNLEAALAGKKVVTRSGKVADILTYYKQSPKPQKLLAVVDFAPNLFADNGKFHLEENRESGLDLFMAPEIVTRWVNVYKQNLHDSEGSAKIIGKCSPNYLTTIKIEIPCT